MSMAPELLSEERDKQPAEVSIEFIYADHSPENLYSVAQAVLASDGDIIAIEKIREGSFGMGTAEEKVALSERMTSFLATDSQINESAAEYFQTDEPFFTALLDGLKGSGKRVVLLDMGTDDPGYSLYRKTQDARRIFRERYREQKFGDSTWEQECEGLYLNQQIATAQQNEYRELVMANQLAALAEENPGTKITAMMGALHTPDGHELSRRYQTVRTFVPRPEETQSYQPIERMRFDENQDTVRKLRLSLKDMGLSVLDDNNSLVPDYLE